MARNYYLVLGVAPDATFAQIQEAYRRLARSTHPDVSGADTTAQFREIQEAWETLRDSNRRQAHDARLVPAQRPRRHGPWPQDPLQARTPRSYPRGQHPFESMLSKIFGWPASIASPAIFHFALQMTPREAVMGGDFALKVPRREECGACNGTGGEDPFLCRRCRGEGHEVAWTSVMVRIPERLEQGQTLQYPLDALGWPGQRLLLHVDITSD